MDLSLIGASAAAAAAAYYFNAPFGMVLGPAAATYLITRDVTSTAAAGAFGYGLNYVARPLSLEVELMMLAKGYKPGKIMDVVYPAAIGGVASVGSQLLT